MPLLWLAALILVIAAIVSAARGEWLAAILLLIAACAIGPGGWSVLDH